MRQRLGADRFAALHADGAALSDADAVGFALARLGHRMRPLAAPQPH
jgi:hypothetical protein